MPIVPVADDIVQEKLRKLAELTLGRKSQPSEVFADKNVGVIVYDTFVENPPIDYHLKFANSDQTKIETLKILKHLQAAGLVEEIYNDKRDFPRIKNESSITTHPANKVSMKQDEESVDLNFCFYARKPQEEVAQEKKQSKGTDVSFFTEKPKEEIAAALDIAIASAEKDKADNLQRVDVKKFKG